MTAKLTNSYAALGKPLPDRKDLVLNRATDSSHKTQDASSAPSGGGKNDGELVRTSNRWRDAYNPLRDLTISRVVQLIESGERGDFAALQWANRKVEKRYPILKGLRTRWDSAIEEMDWDIKTLDKLPPGATKEMAKAQAMHLRSRYELVENLTEALGFVGLADFRGFSILQKHRYFGGEHDGAVRELHWLPQWNFVRDGMFGSFFYNKEFNLGATPELLGEKNRIGSEFLPREDFIIREVESPLYEIALIAFVNWAMGRKDWAAFVEIFGVLRAVITLPPNIPTGKEDEYLAAARGVSENAEGVIPNGATAAFPGSEARNNIPFKEFCDVHDADIVMAGTGGRLTMLTAEKGGLGDGPSSEQDDAFKKVGRAVARKINQTFQRDFDKCELEAAFPGQPCLAYFELAAVEEEDAKAIIDVAVAADSIGLQSEAEEISTKVGLKLIRVEKPNPLPGTDPNGDPTLPGKKITNRGPGLTPEEIFYADLADKVDPVGRLLARLSEIKDDAAMVAAFQQFLTHADKITALVTADLTRLTNALEQITAPAFAAGLEGRKS